MVQNIDSAFFGIRMVRACGPSAAGAAGCQIEGPWRAEDFWFTDRDMGFGL